MKTNVKARDFIRKPKELSSFEKLQRTCCTALLGESNFYEDGESLENRVIKYMDDITKDEAIAVLNQAKNDNKLRHMPLFLVNNMLKKGWVTSDIIERVCTRPDDVTEILAMYWNDKSNKHGLPKQFAKGLQKSFNNFDRYQLSKYRANDKAIKLKDALRIVRPDPNKSKNEDQSKTYSDIINGALKMSEDTWEVAISACGSDVNKKKAEWVRLLTEKTDKGYNKLGSLALLRNLRNIKECGVSEDLIRDALECASMKKILPFQIIAAARYAPEFTDVLEKKLLESMGIYDKLYGDTLFLVDVSGSMRCSLSQKSDINRADAGAGVAAIVDAICERSTVYTFTQTLSPVPKSYHGFAMINHISNNVSGGTEVVRCTNEAIEKFKKSHEGRFPSRVVTITDEADNSYQCGYGKPLMNLPKSCQGYIVNVGTYETGVNYNDSSWVRVSGWSEGIVKFISEYEKLKGHYLK